ncbi:MAG TPA: signal peptidase II [Candidatus Limnocylindria bacterium]
MSSLVPATESRGRLLALTVTALLIVVVDQVTKALVVANLDIGQQVPVLGDLLMIWHVQNRGAAFSLFQGALPLMYLVTLIALGMLVYFYRAFAERGLWLQMLLGVILGGVIGNFVDRVRLGYVTDWLSMGIGDLRWPTYNVADASMFCGIGALVIYLTFFEARRAEAHA